MTAAATAAAAVADVPPTSGQNDSDGPAKMELSHLPRHKSEVSSSTTSSPSHNTCPCSSQFQSTEQVLNAIQTDEATSALIRWLRGEEIQEEGDDFILMRHIPEGVPHANTYGRCPARVSAAFTVLNGIRDGCRSHLDRQQQQSLTAATAAATSALVSSAPSSLSSFPGTSSVVVTSPMKPKYEDDFPSLTSSSGGKAEPNEATIATISTTSTAVSAAANVLVPRKKKKKKPQQPQQIHYQQSKKAASAIETQKQQQLSQQHAKGTTTGKKNDGIAKRRIRPVAITNAPSSSSPWPANTAFDAVKKGNLVHLPSEDPLDIARSSEVAAVAAAARRNSQNAKIISSPSVHRMKPPPGFGSSTTMAVGIDNEQTVGTKMTPRKLDGSFFKSARGEGDIATSTLMTPDKNRSSEPIPTMSGDTLSADIKVDETYMRRIVDIYTALVLNQLVPSVPLELHLLVRLLSLDISGNKYSEGTSDSPSSLGSTVSNEPAGVVRFRQFFATSKACRDFAASALIKLESPILTSLGEIVLRRFIALPAVNDSLPEVIENLRQFIEKDKLVLEKADSSLEGATAAMTITGSSNTAFLTVPFKEDRDSRHNYRSRERTQLFNNREESRDKFMFQLRAFQEIRGTVLDPAQADIYISDIKIACREMISGLLPGNMAWFAGLFCDLLLQIGLVAMEETDKDVLKKVADKDRLKKLHKRLTTKGGQKNRSSQKLVLDQGKSSSSAASSSLQPEHFFIGHQEFFFIFLRAVDSYQFGSHLRQRIVGLLHGMNSTVDARGLEGAVLRMQLLAKFLGMLVFSPNWNVLIDGGPNNKSNAADSKESLAHMNCTTPILDLKEYVEESWRKSRLVVTIPWVCEFVRMATWDVVSLQASYYQKVLALLRSIQKRLGANLLANSQALNIHLVMLQLEVLFADVTGLVKAENLPLVVLPKHKASPDRDSDGVVLPVLDTIPHRISQLYLFASSSYLEEFYKLISEMVENKGKDFTRAGASKKLRPYAIASSVESAESASSPFTKQMQVETSKNNGRLSLMSSSPMSPLNLISPQKGINNRRSKSIQDKLVDAFFHQHNDLRQVCEFVVEKTVANILLIVGKGIIMPTLSLPSEAFKDSFDVFLKLIKQKEQEALEASRTKMKSQSESRVRESLVVLSSPGTKAEVLRIATVLATRHAQEKCEHHISSSIRQEAQKRIDEYIRVETKAKGSASASATASTQSNKAVNGTEKKSTTDEIVGNLRAAIQIMDRLKDDNEALWSLSNSDRSTICDLKTSLEAILDPQNVISWKDYCLVEEECRPFIASLVSVLGVWFASSPDADVNQGYPPLFLDSITAAICLGKIGIPYYGLNRIGKTICDNARHLVIWDDNDSTSRGAISSVLTDLLEAKMITPRMIEGALGEINRRSECRSGHRDCFGMSC